MVNKSEVTVANDHQEEKISESVAEASIPKVEYKAKQVEVKDDKRRQTGDSTVYKYYFGSIGTIFIVTLFVLEVVWAFLQSFPSKLSN
jgi:ATP-binding cassette subfamily C (CFTR/MRP) protein 1